MNLKLESSVINAHFLSVLALFLGLSRRFDRGHRDTQKVSVL